MPGVIYDQNGNIIGTGIDTNRFITDKEGKIINPSTDDILKDIKNSVVYSNDEKLSNLSKESTLQSINNKISNNANGIIVTAQSPIPVSVNSSQLPTGAATENTLSSINNKISTTLNGIKVDGSEVVQPISASSLPLPSGAAKDSTLIDGSQKTQIVDVDGNGIGSYQNSLNVNIKTIQAEIDLNYDSDEVTVYGKNGNNYRAISVDDSGNINAKIVYSELPNNAATESTLESIDNKIHSDLPLENGNLKDIKNSITYIQSNLNTLAQNSTLSSIDSKLKTNNDGVIKADISDYIVNVTAQTLPLPVNAATESMQSQILSQLDSIENYVASEYTLSLINQKLSSNNGHLIIDASQHTVPVNVVSGIGYNNSSVTIYGQSSSSKQPLSVDDNGKLNVNINDTNITNKIDTSNVLLNSIKGQTDKLAFNADRLKVDANISVAPEVEIKNDSGNPVPISALSLPLPDGAATATKQDTSNNLLTGIKTQTDKFSFTGDRLKVDADITMAPEVEIKNDSGNPIPVAAVTLPLPTGAATALKQDTANTLLTSINDNTSKFVFNGTRVLTETIVTNSVEVEVKNDVGNPISSSVISSVLPTGAATSANQDTANNLLNSIKTQTDKLSFNTDKLKVEASVISIPEVEIKNDSGSPIPISGSVSASQSGQWDITNITGTVSLPTGAATENTLSNINTKIGEVQANPTQYTLLDRIKSIYTSLYDIFNGVRLLGWVKKRPDFTRYNNGNSGFDVLVYGPYNLANGASTTVDITIPNGEKWHIELVSGCRRIIGAGGRLASVFNFIWDPTGENRPIQVLYADGATNSVCVGIALVGDGVKVLRCIITNGDAGASDHYFNISVYREVL